LPRLIICARVSGIGEAPNSRPRVSVRPFHGGPVRLSVEQLTDAEFIESLKTNKAYLGIDIDQEFCKMDAWLVARPGKQKTRREAPSQNLSDNFAAEFLENLGSFLHYPEVGFTAHYDGNFWCAQFL
jgi:hypothetical protein